MKHAHTQMLKENAGGKAADFIDHTQAAARALADEAQSTAETVGSQLSGWTQEHGHKVAALWSLGGGRLRRAVLSKPFLSVALVAGAGLLAYNIWKKRQQSQTYSSLQTDQPALEQDTAIHRDSTSATAVQPGVN